MPEHPCFTERRKRCPNDTRFGSRETQFLIVHRKGMEPALSSLEETTVHSTVLKLLFDRMRRDSDDSNCIRLISLIRDRSCSVNKK